MEQFTLANGAVLTVVGDAEKVNGHIVKFLECSICSQDSELWPRGSLRMKRLHLRQGKTPCACSGCPRWTERQQGIRVARALADSHLLFFGWVDGAYRNKESKAILWCDRHGFLFVTVGHIIGSGSRCRPCFYEDSRLDAGEIESKIRTLALRDGLSLISLTKGVPFSEMRVVISCPKHGAWESPADPFLRQGCRCPGCSKGGFKPQSPGFVYALRSDCGAYLKVGITGETRLRFRTLRKATPFDFSIVGLRGLWGSEAKRLEKELLQSFETAGLSGFDGATEWLRYNPAILERLRA